MGSLLGPADGSTTTSASLFAAQGIGTVRVGYRKPNDLSALRARPRGRDRSREPVRRTAVRHGRALVRWRGRGASRRDPRRALPRGRHAGDAVGRMRARRPARRHAAVVAARHRRRDPAARDERRWCRCSRVTARSCCSPGAGHLLDAGRGRGARLGCLEWIPARFVAERLGAGQLGDDAGELVDVVVAEHDVGQVPTPRAAAAAAR